MSAADFHRPVRMPSGAFEGYEGAADPAQLNRAAHDSATALLARVREDPDPEVVERLVSFTDEHGIDTVAELWSRAGARSLPGALWRIYLLRALIRQDPVGMGVVYEQGAQLATTGDRVVAGAASPTGPDEVLALADQILRGAFTGDFAIALERAASFCRITALGAAGLADTADLADSERGGALTTRALRLSQLAAELSACARLWRRERLD
ncbi:DNA-directed RNA polymerase subunit beta [Agromyces sp. SYSU T00194]|uniref:DNA-directed RNA polymerase subunit beta n=1 Tax=Agromyces chitinivorans TaxID=3158560 RepID=UPI0033983CE6